MVWKYKEVSYGPITARVLGSQSEMADSNPVTHRSRYGELGSLARAVAVVRTATLIGEVERRCSEVAHRDTVDESFLCCGRSVFPVVCHSVLDLALKYGDVRSPCQAMCVLSYRWRTSLTERMRGGRTRTARRETGPKRTRVLTHVFRLRDPFCR